MTRLLPYLDSLPTLDLGYWPTPLQFLPNLSRELNGPRIWIKRDDNSGLATGGNKSRKLEFLLGRALHEGKNAVVTFGALQSNHARQTAAACAVAGMPCHLILRRQVERANPQYERGGNLLLNDILGATVHKVDPGDEREQELLTELRSQYNLCLIPPGGSNSTGALGYVACARELVEQASAQNVELHHVVHASASAGTQAGLVAGFSALGSNVCVTGINVYHPDPTSLKDRVTEIAQDLRDKHPDLAQNALAEVVVNHAYLGEGYGQPTAETVEAIKLAARLEGILLDPVYSGKAFAALIDQISIGNFSDAEDVIFIHTGGSVALHAYDEIFD